MRGCFFHALHLLFHFSDIFFQWRFSAIISYPIGIFSKPIYGTFFEIFFQFITCRLFNRF